MPDALPPAPPPGIGSVEIVLANGRRVRASADADAAALARLVRALEAAA